MGLVGLAIVYPLRQRKVLEAGVQRAAAHCRGLGSPQILTTSYAKRKVLEAGVQRAAAHCRGLGSPQILTTSFAAAGGTHFKRSLTEYYAVSSLICKHIFIF
jgi:hypothetical protein